MTADDPRVQRARELLQGTIRADHESEEARGVIRGLLAACDERSEQKALAENHRIAANERAEAAEAEVERLDQAIVDLQRANDDLTEALRMAEQGLS